MKRGTVGGMPSRVKLPVSPELRKTPDVIVSQAALFASAYIMATKRNPGISAREAMQNAARNMQRLMLKPPY